MPKRTDANQQHIVAGLREFGASVKDCHEMKGAFDILVGYRGKDYKFELKSERGKLTDAEQEFHRSWKGSPIYIVHDLLEAIEIIQEAEEE